MSQVFASMPGRLESVDLIDVGTSRTAILTGPADGITSLAIEMVVSNKTTSPIDLTVEFYNGSTYTSLVYEKTVPANDSLEVAMAARAVRASEAIYLTAGSSTGLDATLSYMRIE